MNRSKLLKPLMTPDQRRISQAFKARAAAHIDRRLQDAFDRYKLKPGDKMDFVWTIDLSCTIFCHSDGTVSVDAERYASPALPPAIESCYSIKGFIAKYLSHFFTPDIASVVFGEIIKSEEHTKIHFILCLKGINFEHINAWTQKEMENDSLTARITRELQFALTKFGFPTLT
jgi:hypothetical protein